MYGVKEEAIFVVNVCGSKNVSSQCTVSQHANTTITMTYASWWYILQQISSLTPTEANITCNVRGFVLAVGPYLMAIFV